jgi:uncharacterized LabA/DUF88 family protein
MARIAIFVDAGYLFAQGSTALTGSKKRRTQLTLNETAAVAELISIAAEKTNNATLLRVYWYDGVTSRGPTLEHESVARTDNVKIRLGFVNSQGQQKGVDSLIVTDLIDLARNHAISDALLLSGDEDVRIGVQIAQSFGVRVHLLGIEPSRGSQSKQLLNEADTTTEWLSETVSKFLSVNPEPAAIATLPATAVASAEGASNSERTNAILMAAISELASTLEGDQIQKLKTHWLEKPTIPPEFDGRLLARCRDALGRTLEADEKREMRVLFRQIIGELKA